MVDINTKLIELLRDEATFLKLKSRTKLCTSELTERLNNLKEEGYLINRKFNSYGAKFVLSDIPETTLQDNISFSNCGKFKFLVLSDTHVGNVYENLDSIVKSYQYAEYNNIRYVINLGDLVEGPQLDSIYNPRIKTSSITEQVEFFAGNYPQSDNITTLYILGNHDERCLEEGIDISKIIDSKRYDMHFLGYKNSKLAIGNNTLILHHPYGVSESNKYDNEINDLYVNQDYDLILRGHTHHNHIYINNMGCLVINVPACYDSPSRKYKSIYEVDLMDDCVEIKNLIVADDVNLVSTLTYPLKSKKLIKSIKL